MEHYLQAREQDLYIFVSRPERMDRDFLIVVIDFGRARLALQIFSSMNM